MRVLSLFDGISCAYEALLKANIPITSYHASEIDPYALRVSEARHPDIVRLGDVRTVKARPIDLLIGGSPCQDLSVAKKGRKGLEGDRSGLFYEYVRLLEECNPRYFILENVASMSEDAKNLITLIMGVEPIMIDASLVSAQSRKRLFWTNIPFKGLPADRGILVRDILQKEVDPKYLVKAPVALRETDKVVGVIRVGLLEGLSNSQGNRVYSTDGKTVTLSANGGGGGAKTGLYAIGRDVGRRLDGKGVRQDHDKTLPVQRRIETRADNKCGTLTSVYKDNLVVGESIVRRLTPLECEKLQCLPEHYTEGISDAQRYKCLGNAFNVDVIAHILGGLKETK